jgi:protein O-mannosyl-transferase
MSNYPTKPSVHLFPVFILIVLTVICYANTLNVPFVFDDIPNIVENKAIHINALNLESLRNAGFNSLMPSRPLANISFALNYYFGKLDVAGYHLMNIFIHAINGVLVYLLAFFLLSHLCKKSNRSGDGLKLNKVHFISIIAACFFVVHPIQIQSVTYVVQRMNSLATMFYLTALLAYLYGRVNNNKTQSYICYLISLAGFVFAISSKEIAAMLPVTIIMSEWLIFNQSFKQFISSNMSKILALSCMSILVALIFLGEQPIDRILIDYTYREFSLSERLLTELRVVVFYVSLVIFPLPSRLNLIHEFEISQSLFEPITTVLSLMLIISALFFAFRMMKKNKIVTFCIFWFFLHLLIESSFIGLEIIFEHRLYLPMVGLCLLLSFMLNEILEQNKILPRAISVLLVISLALGTVIRNQSWASEESLWLDVVSKNQSSYRAFYNLGNMKTDLGNISEAIEYYQQALSINSAYPKAHNNLGIAFNKQGNIEMAMFHYKIAMAINPIDPSPNFNLAIALDSLGRTEEAIIENKNAVNKNPAYTAAYYNLANIFERIGETNEAKFHYEKTIQLEPFHARANNNLGILLAEVGDLDAAEEKFHIAIEGDPDFLGPYLNLAKLYLVQDNAQAACEILNANVLTEELVGDIPPDIITLCNN